MKMIFAALCIGMTLFADAQTFPNFGNPTSAERQLIQCDLNPDADAVVLIREAVADYNDEYNLVTRHHVRIKILKENGTSYADVTLPFISRDNFEYIRDVEAVVINVLPDGGISRQTLDRKNIYTKKINDHRSIVTFSMPSVKVGSIIEYTYTSIMKSYAGLEQWNFQEELPVLVSKYAVTIVPHLQFNYLLYKNSGFEIDIKNDAHTGRVSFQMERIPALENEPYMDARRDYLQRVIFQISAIVRQGSRQKYMSSWSDVIRELMMDRGYGAQLNKKLDGTEDFLASLKLVTNEEEKIRRVYEYVRDNMSWNGYYGVYTSDAVKDVWEKKSGSITGINLILVNLLESAGLEAYPMLVSDRSYGKVSEQYPYIDQFSQTIAFVRSSGKKYYLDATEKYLPINIIPSKLLNTTGLIVNRKSGGIERIADENLAFRESTTVSVSFDSSGVIKGKAIVYSHDYAKNERRSHYRANPASYVEGNFRKVAGLELANFEIANEDKDSLPLMQKLDFSLPVNEGGDYRYLNYNLFTGFTSNPFIAPNRFSTINFGYKRLLSTNFYVTLPTGYTIDALPKSVQINSADKAIQFSREILIDEKSSQMLIRLRIDFRQSVYEYSRYGEIKEFYKKMFDLLNEQVVFKKVS